MSAPVVWTPIPDPFSSKWLCLCGQLWPDQLGAVKCARHHQKAEREPLPPVPVIPGVSMHRPTYVPAGARYAPTPRVYVKRRSWSLRIGLVLMLAAAVALLGLLFLSTLEQHGGPPALFVTPAPMPTPCPTGGVACYSSGGRR